MSLNKKLIPDLLLVGINQVVDRATAATTFVLQGVRAIFDPNNPQNTELYYRDDAGGDHYFPSSEKLADPSAGDDIGVNAAGVTASKLNPALAELGNTKLAISDNLSDLNNVPTARTNLGLGTSAVLDVGTGANNIIQLDGNAKLPAIDGSQLTNVISTDTTKLAILNNLSDLNDLHTARTNLGLGTAAVLNTGTGANNVVQLDGNAKLPAIDGSQLTNIALQGLNSVLTQSNTSSQDINLTSGAGLNVDGEVDIGDKTRITENGNALELFGTTRVYMTFHQTGGSISGYFGFYSPDSADIYLMNETSTGDLRLGTNGTTRLIIYQNGSITVLGDTSINSKTRINENGTALELFGTDHCFMAFHKTGGSRSGYFGFDSSSNNHITLMNETSNGEVRLGTNGTTRLTIDSNGDVKIGSNNVVTESPYFTDGWVNVPSSWISSLVTVTETLQYRVDETGTIEFSGRCYNTNATSSRLFPILNANGLPSYLRPDVKQRGALACEVSGVTTCLYYFMSTNSQLYIYQDSNTSGSFGAGDCYVGMTTLKYKITG